MCLNMCEVCLDSCIDWTAVKLLLFEADYRLETEPGGVCQLLSWQVKNATTAAVNVQPIAAVHTSAWHWSCQKVKQHVVWHCIMES